MITKAKSTSQAAKFERAIIVDRVCIRRMNQRGSSNESKGSLEKIASFVTRQKN